MLFSKIVEEFLVPGALHLANIVFFDRTVPLADRLVSMSHLPVLRSTLADVISIVNDMRP